MIDWRNFLLQTVRPPEPPQEFKEDFKRTITLFNCRQVKLVTIPLLIALIIFMVADYLTIAKSGLHSTWNGILTIRPIAIIACVLFYWQLGPLRNTADLKPKHTWLWKAFTCFFLFYTTLIVSYMFPIKESIAPIYVLLLGPTIFLALTPIQAVGHLGVGYAAIIVALYSFAPESSSVKFQLINTGVLLWAGFIISRLSYQSAFRDFMNRKVIGQKTNELRDAHAKEQAANRAKSEFLAAISHEIRTPMNSILGMTEIALHTKLSREQRDYIETARESGLMLMDVINDILDFSKIETQKFRLISAHFDLPSVIHAAIKTVRLTAEQKGLSLDFEIMSDVPRFLKGDPGRLRQVIINLLDNGITYTDEGYVRLTVGVWTEDSGDKKRPVGLRFSVKDSGPGISDDDMENLFDAYAQGDESTSRVYGGSGLGLTISQKLVGFMGGSISVRSVLGKGAEFIFTARFGEGDPDKATEPELMNASWAVNLPIKPSKVLLIDDNPLNVKVELLHLNRMGMKTTVAETGEAALSLLAKETFDIVLMDLEMPEMDGYKTTHHIRNGEFLGKSIKQPDIPILAVTAHALSEVRDRCERSGMDGFVSKPVGFGELGAAMRQILGGDWHSPPPAPSTDGPAVLDIIQAANSLGVTKSEINHLVPNAMLEIQHKFDLAEKGLESSKLREVALQAHTLKSIAASIGAEKTRRAAVKLENASRRDDGPLSLQRLEELRLDLLHLQRAVDAL